MTFLYVLFSVIFLLFTLILIVPNTYHISQEVIIDKPVTEVFDFVKLIRNHHQFSPWIIQNSNLTHEIIGVDGVVGCINKWECNKKIFSGEQEIVKILENDIVHCELRIHKPLAITSEAYFKVNEINASKTKLTMGFTGDNEFPKSVFIFFFHNNQKLGNKYDADLLKLKQLVETKTLISS